MKRRYRVGVDLGGTNTKIALFKGEKDIIARKVLSTKVYKTRYILIEKLIKTINELLRENDIKRDQLQGLGIGVAGPVDFKKGLIHKLVNVKGWKRVPLKNILEHKLDIRTYLDNDVNLVTLGEYKYGAGRGTKNMICITLGTGVGGGIILEGELYRGSDFTAGEVGHIPVNIKGPRCNCGGRACLERYVGSKYIVQRAKRLIKQKPHSRILSLTNGKTSRITPKVISKAANEGDKIAIKIWKETGLYIGVALAGLVNVFDPERIVIGGGVSLAGKVLFDAIRRTVSERAMDFPSRKLKIVPATLGDDAGLTGASILIAKST